ncbi:MAG TPA: hypothetical protein VH856_09195 [Steroidobacteraceae bacterium]|jgi:hypothetical protein
MRRSVTLAALACCALARPALTLADDSRLRRYELPNADALEMTLPAGWLDAVDEQPGSAEITIELRPESGGAFEVFVTPESNERAPGRIQDAGTLREAVRDAAARAGAQGGPGPPEIRRLQGADGVGFYFVASETMPPPGEFGHLVQGALFTGALVLRFEILTHDPGDPAVGEALAMLQGALHRDRGLDRP